MIQKVLCVGIGLVLATAVCPAVFAAGQAKYFVLVVWDGMRPDFVSPEQHSGIDWQADDGDEPAGG